MWDDRRKGHRHLALTRRALTCILTRRANAADTRQEISADQLAGGGVIEGDDYAASQLTSLRDLPARLLTWWYTAVVEKSDYDSTPVRVSSATRTQARTRERTHACAHTQTHQHARLLTRRCTAVILRSADDSTPDTVHWSILSSSFSPAPHMYTRIRTHAWQRKQEGAISLACSLWLRFLASSNRCTVCLLCSVFDVNSV